MLSQTLHARFTQRRTLEQHNAWPPNGVFDDDLINLLSQALIDRYHVLITGDSGSGKSTLQLAALRRASQGAKVTFLDPTRWTQTAQLKVGSIRVFESSKLITHAGDVLGVSELRICDHARYLQNREQPICDADLANVLVAAARAGCGTTATFPVGGSLHATVNMINGCYPQIWSAATLAITIEKNWPTYTYSLWT